MRRRLFFVFVMGSDFGDYHFLCQLALFETQPCGLVLLAEYLEKKKKKLYFENTLD